MERLLSLSSAALTCLSGPRRHRPVMNQIKRATTTIAAVMLAAMPFAACGGGGGGSASDDADQEVASLGTEPDAPVGSDNTASTAPLDPEEAQLAFAECMREHGIDMPDPGADGGIQIMATPETEDEMNAAMEDCQPLLANARGAIEMDPEQEAEMREQLLEFTECMRDQGIDLPDPVFSDDGGFSVQAEAGEGGGATGGPRADEDFQAAADECGGDGGALMISTDTVVAE
ncbi:MAG: hypothetical protein K0S92_1086 [Desertimonas sp.]|nr:hypothetical protein [Desertimonas sp.]